MRLIKLANIIFTKFFTLWIILFSLFTYLYPGRFVDLNYLIVPTLGIIMFGMGMTLRMEDFGKVLKKPTGVIVGVACQYLLMPLVGFTLAVMFSVEPLIATGIVLVGSCPGGTASNVITYLAKGDLALSVTLTTVSTLICPFMIPLIMYLFAGQWIDIPVLKLFISAFEIVLIPVFLGLLVRYFLREKTEDILPAMPLVSSLAIIFIVGVIVAANVENIRNIGLLIALTVIIHNLAGLSLGYTAAKAFNFDEKKCRAISIEVGMQNSGLGVALASSHFGTLAALPAAIFSIWHNISGSTLAWIWQRKN